VGVFGWAGDLIHGKMSLALKEVAK
jgi:hypothetical protein